MLSWAEDVPTGLVLKNGSGQPQYHLCSTGLFIHQELVEDMWMEKEEIQACTPFPMTSRGEFSDAKG